MLSTTQHVRFHGFGMGSLPDEESQPDDVILLARVVAARANEHLIVHGVTVKPMKYDAPNNIQS